MKKISPTMKLAIATARQNGERLIIQWGWRTWCGMYNDPQFQDRTIQALVHRGLAVYTNWELTELAGLTAKTDPIEVTLTPKAAEV